MARRVVVTGLGPVTSLGEGKESFWRGLCEGRSGVCRVDDLIDLEGIPVLIGAPVAEFDPLRHIEPKKSRRLDRSTQLALAAAGLAIADAGIDLDQLDCDRTGVVAGTGIGGMQTFE